ncbi:MFS general substrate transporter [Ganoderma sinense ZZ0214-1]|uniref:MFS general substrate transporter n=1 Tax=Ganoderma sinense ZZ0214-1 TaxID=1077348 RepID=A0A2G8RN52_9APHY|nr:MFS general substrate transporter [Ganoderma sinense ZZ0214-1]
MDIPLTTMPQDSVAASSTNAVHRKQPVTVAPEEDMVVVALEDIVPTLPNREVDTRAITKAMHRKAWIQFAALGWSIFICGWNDGTTGPLIPRLQEVYQVSYGVVSLIFVAGCVGYIVGASVYLYLTERFGFGVSPDKPNIAMPAASFMIAIGNSLRVSTPPFPVFVVGFLLIGFGGAFLFMQDAGSNAFVVSLSGDTSTKMGILHAVYGAGATCAPLVSTQFAQLPCWSFGYLVHIGLALMSAVFQAFAFKFKSQDGMSYSVFACEVGETPHERTEDSARGFDKYKQVFRVRAVHLMAFFLFTYVGLEFSIGSWIVTFVINERHGGPSAGYISSGFFAGLTIGRLALLPLNKKLGQSRVIFLYLLITLGLELVVWLVPSLIGGGVTVAFVGFLLGPIFPIVMGHAGGVLPPELIVGAVGWMASFASAGAAVFPFVTGALASGTSINSLQPL